MAIPKNINNLKDIEIYIYDTNEKGDIDISFHINEPGDYKIKVNNNTLKSMELLSKINKEREIK